MKLLYVGCGHPMQSTDDCLMWAKLGLEWYDTSYYHTLNTGDCGEIGPFFGGPAFYKDLLSNFNERTKCDDILNKKDLQFTGSICNNLWHFSRSFIEKYNFDIIFFNHLIENVENNWEVIKDKRVILKTFGMHPVNWEPRIKKLRDKGVFVVRNNPTECLRGTYFKPSPMFSYNRNKKSQQEFKKVSLYAGHDAIIRGCIVRDENEVSCWTGKKKEVVTFSSAFNHKDSGAIRRRNLYLEIKNRSKYRFRLFGSCNDNEPLSEGFVSHKEKIEILRGAKVVLVTGTPGSTNTYSLVEALVMGVPIVVFDKSMWNSEIYEVDQIIKDGENGFIAKDCIEAAKLIDQIMEDDKLAQKLSKNARTTGIELYGRSNRAKDWYNVFTKKIWEKPQDKKREYTGGDVLTLDGTPLKNSKFRSSVTL
jgi:glycosyltransferase involved in cell wall biosynthesis